MVDNVNIQETGSTPVATDDISGAHYQRVKITSGVADSTVHLKIVEEDVPHASGDSGIMLLAVRSDTAASTSGATGDYQPLITNSTGHLWVDASGQTLTVGSHAVTNAGTFAVQATVAAAATSIAKAEDAPHTTADVGTAVLAVIQDTPAASAADGDYGFPKLNAAGEMWVQESRAITATLSNLASSTTSAQIVAATATRKGLMLFNDDANGVYVKYGTTASSTSYSVLIPSNGYWEMPVPIYTGRVDAVWVADGTGSLRVTELT